MGHLAAAEIGQNVPAFELCHIIKPTLSCVM
jgi:hypothetical protein